MWLIFRVKSASFLGWTRDMFTSGAILTLTSAAAATSDLWSTISQHSSLSCGFPADTGKVDLLGGTHAAGASVKTAVTFMSRGFVTWSCHVVRR